MSLRSTCLKISSGLIAAAAIAFAVNAQTLNESSYKPVASPINVSTGDKIEVAELFWFGCGHCFALEPALKTWKEIIPDNAKFVKVPAIFSKRWEFHGKAFYTMKSLDVPEQAYDDFFKRIHVDRKRMDKLDSLVTFLADFDKTEKQVESAFNSFEVDTKVRTAMKISRQSGATGVPSMIVDGKYLTTQQLAKSTPGMFNTVNELIKKAASER